MIIDINLSKNGLKEAIQRLERYKQHISKRVIQLNNKLLTTGKSIIVKNIQEVVINKTIADGLSNSVEAYYDPNLGVIFFVKASWAVFVEYGTGIVGSQNQHPNLARTGWIYDINEHGEKGWWYVLGGKSYHTRGQPSQPFMFKSYLDLKNIMSTIAKDTFK